VYGPLQFHKRSQLFVGTHRETLSVVTMSVNNPDRSPLRSRAEIQPQLRPALLRLSAMISKDFIGRRPISLPDGFPTQRNLSANVIGLNDLLARVRCRETLCP
jgi:hypothetical protein